MVIERLSNLLMLITSSQFAGSRAIFTSTVHLFRVGCAFIVLCYLRCGAKLNNGCGCPLLKRMLAFTV